MASPQPIITPAPQAQGLKARQDSQQMLIGYFYNSVSSRYIGYSCLSGSTWTVSSTFGRCWTTATSAYLWPTACSGSTALYRSSGLQSSLVCPTTCNTDYVFQTQNDATPTVWVGCADVTTQSIYYRVPPTTAVTTSSSRSSSSSSQSSSSSPSTTPTPYPTPTPTPTPTPAPAASKAWIAGAVIGPLAGLAIIGLIVWVVLLKKRNKKKSEQQANNYGQAPPPMAQTPQTHQQQPYYPPNSPQPQYAQYPSPVGSPPPQWSPQQQAKDNTYPQQQPMSPVHDPKVPYMTAEQQYHPQPQQMPQQQAAPQKPPPAELS